MVPSSLPERLARIRNVCAAQPVLLAYVFGSHARGTADAESDLDIAVLTEPGLSQAERRALRLRLMHSCAQALGLILEQIDIVILQDVPVLLQFNAIRNGIPVFVRDPDSRRAYEFDVERSYDDEEPLLEDEANLTLDRILSRRA